MLGRLALSFACLPALAFAQDVEHGRDLAERWCVNCHVVSRAAASGRADGLPSLPAIANNPATTSASLRGVMTTSHGRMPDLSLTNREQSDLIAYIFSLRQSRQ
jgi:mono/diheme cytochrome c family protein